MLLIVCIKDINYVNYTLTFLILVILSFNLSLKSRFEKNHGLFKIPMLKWHSQMNEFGTKNVKYV